MNKYRLVLERIDSEYKNVLTSEEEYIINEILNEFYDIKIIVRDIEVIKIPNTCYQIKILKGE